MDHIQEIADLTAFEAIKRDNPYLVENIAKLLQSGLSPRQIAKMADNSPFMHSVVLCAANYLKSHPEEA